MDCVLCLRMWLSFPGSQALHNVPGQGHHSHTGLCGSGLCCTAEDTALSQGGGPLSRFPGWGFPCAWSSQEDK